MYVIIKSEMLRKDINYSGGIIMTDKERKQFLKKVYQAAFDYEKDYGFCSQAVLAALQDHFAGIDDEVIKGSHALAGGGALKGDGSCGALVGGMAAISCFFGRSRDEFGESDSQLWMGSSILANKVRERFIEEFGSVICNKVQEEKFGRSYNLWNEDDYKAFEEAGGHEDKCPDVTGKVAKWTAEILLDEGIKSKNK